MIQLCIVVSHKETEKLKGWKSGICNAFTRTLMKNFSSVKDAKFIGEKMNCIYTIESLNS